MAAKKKKKIPVSRKPLASEKEIRKLRREVAILRAMAGHYWVMKNNTGEAYTDASMAMAAAHEKWRHAAVRGFR